MTLTREQCEEFAAVGFLCSLMIVVIHSSNMTNMWLSGSTAVPVWVAALHFVVRDTFPRCALPWFFAASGFFLVKHLDAGDGVWPWWRRTVVRRIHTLLVPYLLWNLFYYLFRLALGRYAFEPVHVLRLMTGWDFSNDLACFPFWYIRTLLVYAAFAPVFVILLRLRGMGIAVLAALAGAWFADAPTFGISFQPLHWESLLFFGGGVFAALHGAPNWFVPRGVRSGILAVFALACAGVVTLLLLREQRFLPVCVRVMLLSGCATLAANLSRVRRLLLSVRPLWGFAFFVYAQHTLLTGIVRDVTRQLFSPIWQETVGFGLRIGVGIIGSLAMGAALRRFAPRLFCLLCGGRVP